LKVPPASLSFPRLLLFAALLTSATLLLFLGGLELALRSVGYGYSPHFARSVTLPGGEKIWRENRWVTAPYFSPSLVRRPVPFRLPGKKAPGTYRIFVLGSSAAMGDPEPSFSISRTLEKMLRATYPAKNFEVINAGITAINSHLVRGIAEDCAQLEPDLFIVYEGNNEVIGPFGPVGVFTPFFRTEAIVRVAVWLKGTRTGQLVGAAVRKFRQGNKAPVDWGGMQMFLQQQIAVNDPRLDAVRALFRANLLAIADAAHAAGAHTLLCTVATNQRDFAPFLSEHRSDLKAADLARWQAAFNAAEKSARSGDLVAAESSYRAALAIDSTHAELVFQLGRLLLQTGRITEAQTLLQRALDLDTLRFRTDSSLNQVIRSLASSSNHGLEVVDLATALAARSTGGLIGDELLYEHVHPTLRGSYEIASELLPHVIAQLAQRGGTSGAPGAPLDYGEIRMRLGFTTHEQAMIALELLNRFKSPPFNTQADHASRLANWQRRADTASALLARPDALPALREIYQRALATSPGDWILARNAGAMFVARHSPAEAVTLLEQAKAEIDDDVDTLVALGWAQRALGHVTESASAFAQVRLLEPRYPGLPNLDVPAKP
jgi:tetratricopeptide (TPR) repeat protein